MALRNDLIWVFLAALVSLPCSSASVSAQASTVHPGPHAPPVADVAPPGFAVASAEQIAHAQETLRLRVRKQELLVSNRHWEVPAIGLGLGVGSLAVGAVVFASAWADSGYCSSSSNGDSDCQEGDYNRARDVTGLVMMPLGAALIITSVPMLIIRLVRHQELKRVERALDYLQQQASLDAARGGLAFKF